MAWLSDYSDLKTAQGRAQQAIGLPIGMASPLWLAFGAAATAGVAWWLMTRWTQALNVEALAGAAETAAVATLEAAPAAALEAVVADAAVAPAAEEAVIEAVADTPVEPSAEAPVAAEPDDLTRLVGIGPKLAAALASHGVTSFAQIAAWTEEDLASFDAALSLKGRALRDRWVAQAADLTAA